MLLIDPCVCETGESLSIPIVYFKLFHFYFVFVVLMLWGFNISSHDLAGDLTAICLQAVSMSQSLTTVSRKQALCFCEKIVISMFNK